MDFDQFENRLSWKKVIVIVLGCFFAFWIVREILFFEFMRAFKNTYSQFTTKFDKDQNTIHNIIEDNFKKQQAMQKDMDEKTEKFHRYVDNSLDKTLAYLNSDTKPSSPAQQKNSGLATPSQHEEDKDWQRIQEAYLAKTGQTLPSYDELNKNASMGAIDSARDKELDLIDQKHDAIRAAWKKEREELDKKYWEMARLRYFQTTGKALPSYEEIEQSLVTFYERNKHD